MATETFTERFKRLTSSLSEAELAMTLDLSPSALRKIRDGDTQSLKLDAALRLCRRLQISPWELQGEADPAKSDGRPKPPAHDRLGRLEGQVADLQTVALQVGKIDSALGALLRMLESAEELPDTLRARLRLERGAA